MPYINSNIYGKYVITINAIYNLNNKYQYKKQIISSTTSGMCWWNVIVTRFNLKFIKKGNYFSHTRVVTVISNRRLNLTFLNINFFYMNPPSKRIQRHKNDNFHWNERTRNKIWLKSSLKQCTCSKLLGFGKYVLLFLVSLACLSSYCVPCSAFIKDGYP